MNVESYNFRVDKSIILRYKLCNIVLLLYRTVIISIIIILKLLMYYTVLLEYVYRLKCILHMMLFNVIDY